MAIGRQDRSKGFDWFCRLFAENHRLRESMLFAFGGKVSQDLARRPGIFHAIRRLCLQPLCQR